MLQRHCDRCGRAPASQESGAELSGALLQDHGLNAEGIGPLRVSLTVETFDGHLWQKRDLCAHCWTVIAGTLRDHLQRYEEGEA